MANKLKQKLIGRARETTRQPKSSQVTKPAKKGYRIVPVSLYTPQAAWIDLLTKQLKEMGNHKANRSFVVQEAILRLKEGFANMTPEQISNDIIEATRRRSAEENKNGLLD